MSSRMGVQPPAGTTSQSSSDAVTIVPRYSIPAMTAHFEPSLTAGIERPAHLIPAPRALVEEDVRMAPWLLSSDDEAGPCTTFTCFPICPAEIRLRIWRYMLPGPRLVVDRTRIRYGIREGEEIRVTFAYHRKCNTNVFTYGDEENITIPIALWICAESRYETLKTYTRIGRQYINFGLDTLWKTMPLPSNPAPHQKPWIQSVAYEVLSIANSPSFFMPPYENIIKNFPNIKEILLKCNCLALGPGTSPWASHYPWFRRDKNNRHRSAWQQNARGWDLEKALWVVSTRRLFTKFKIANPHLRLEDVELKFLEMPNPLITLKYENPDTGVRTACYIQEIGSGNESKLSVKNSDTGECTLHYLPRGVYDDESKLEVMEQVRTNLGWAKITEVED